MMKIRSSRAVLTATFTLTALLASILAAVAAGTGTVTPPPKIAIVANAFNGADALAVGPTAGQFGAPIFTTNKEGLSEAAKAGIVAYGPALVIVVGGTGALSDTVLTDLSTALGLDIKPENTHPAAGIVRIKGDGRMETAVAISELLGAYNPAFLPDAATATDSDLLDGMDSTAFLGATATAANADKLDNLDSTAFALKPAFAVIKLSGTTLSVLSSRGLTSAIRTSQGDYTLTWASDISACAWTGGINTRNGAIQTGTRTLTLNGGGGTASNVINAHAEDGSADTDISFSVTITC